MPEQDFITNLIIDKINLSDSELKYKILKHIRSLNINKARDRDGISIRMLKMCDKSISKPLCKLFRKCIETGYFPNPGNGQM